MDVISGLDLWNWRKQAIERAIASEISPQEVDWLLQELAGLDRLSLRLETYKNLPQIQLPFSLEQLDSLWQQRLDARMPVQYLAGVTPWRKFSLKVSPDVLIPRPETEILIDLAVAATEAEPQLKSGNWADLGTGSGAIALGLAEAFPQAIVHAVDASTGALAIAKTNAQNLQLASRIEFYQGSWFEPLAHLKTQLTGMISNPPYIPTQLVSQLQPEVTRHEPHLALDGGADGLESIRHLVAIAPAYLRPGGIWLIEMMAGQAPAVLELLQHQGSYDRLKIFPDFAGIERFALAYRR